jgi:hypothetical protein
MKRNAAIWVLVIANVLAAIGLLVSWPWQSGLRGMFFFVFGLLHIVLAAGLWRLQNWARILMIAYALFQLTGLGIWTLITLAMVQMDGSTPESTRLFLLAGVALPLLLWAVIYLLRPAGQSLFLER